MAVFAIADLHLSLAGQNKSMEVFGGRWHDYVNKIEANWNRLVGAADSVIIPGDISWGSDISECREDFEFLNGRLNGVKYMLKGNHDYWWNTAAKMARAFEAHGFDKLKTVHNNAYICDDYIICGSRGWFIDEESEHDKKIMAREVGRLGLSIQAAKKLQAGGGREIIAFLHYPPVWEGYACAEIMELLEREQIKRCYFGHVHGAAQKIKEHGGVMLELVSSDYLGFAPLEI